MLIGALRDLGSETVADVSRAVLIDFCSSFAFDRSRESLRVDSIHQCIESRLQFTTNPFPYSVQIVF